MSGWNKKRSVMRRYDAAAHIYDMRYAEEQEAKFEAALKNIDARNLGLVLDDGCGTGLLFDYVARKADMVVGIDISKKTLQKAKEHAKDFRNVHLISADADHLPFVTGIFNHVFAFTLIQNTPDPLASLKEAMLVAKTDALIVVTGLKKIFSRESLVKLLREAGLEVQALENECLKCYVAVCTRFIH